MKTVTLDAGGMLSVLDYRAVEKQLSRLPGVRQVTASIASNSVTFAYDETVVSVGTLRDAVVECGFHCSGEILPKHVCEPHAGYVHHHGAHGNHEPAPVKSPVAA